MTFSVRDFEATADKEAALHAKAARLHDLSRQRDRHFRRSVMADAAMAIMLSLFLSEMEGVPLSQGNLSLLNLIEDEQVETMLEQLIHAGLADVTGENPERRTVGLTALGSARMRSYVGDFPEI